MSKEFFEIGKVTGDINVRISFRIIQLFSEGLYSSPHKAVEELVCNSFDAGATAVHIRLSPDLHSEDACIAIIDNGESMDDKGLEEHWIIGRDRREERKKHAKGRIPIGKFGIGKLATYVLANRLTHICKKKGIFYSTSMNYSSIPDDNKSSIYSESTETGSVKLPLRSLSEEEARVALSGWLSSDDDGLEELNLFGEDASASWTVAVMSELKGGMVGQLKRGRLRYVLETAMPLRDDFKLFLDDTLIKPSKTKGSRIKRWVLGRHIKALPKIDDLEVSLDATQDKKSDTYFGLIHSELGRITGYAELYEDLLTTGKSAERLGRSFGFFVYVRGRLININDEYFGIDSNDLRHGTFSRFRMVINVDKLDEELRSSRENIREGMLATETRKVLKAVFNEARREHKKKIEEGSPGARFSSAISMAPFSLTTGPLIGLVERAFKGEISPRYIDFPTDPDPESQSDFIERLKSKSENLEDYFSDAIIEDLLEDNRIAFFDVEKGQLKINSQHPFIAQFLDEYEDYSKSLPLELLAMSEILLEAELYKYSVDESQIKKVLSERDELLRFLAKSTRRRNARIVALALLDAANDEKQLEIELAAAFDSMGFEAIHIGKSGKPDGYAIAHLGYKEKTNRDSSRYKVSLEAKSTKGKSKRVAAKTVDISGVIRHRNDYECDHAIVVAPGFQSSGGVESALYKEIMDDKNRPEKTLTLVNLSDMARLVRLVPQRRIGLERIQDLFLFCTMPEESTAWIDTLENSTPEKINYKPILEAIWDCQTKRSGEPVDYGAITVTLDHSGYVYSRETVIKVCRSLEALAPQLVVTRQSSVELNQRPDRIIAMVRSESQEYPQKETGSGFSE